MKTGRLIPGTEVAPQGWRPADLHGSKSSRLLALKTRMLSSSSSVAGNFARRHDLFAGGWERQHVSCIRNQRRWRKVVRHRWTTAGRHSTLVIGKDGSLIGIGRKNSNIDGKMPVAISKDGGKTYMTAQRDFSHLVAASDLV